MIVSIDDVILGLVHVVAFMTIALVSVEIDDQEALVTEPLLHVLGDESDVRVDTEAATVRTIRMVVTTAKVDGPATVLSDASSVDRASTGSHHGIEYAHTEEPARQEDEGQLDAS